MFSLKMQSRTSLVVQWLTIHLPTPGTWVQSLIWEDPTCRGATKPLCHKYWACERQLLTPSCPGARAPQLESGPCSLQLEKVRTQQWRPSAAKNKLINQFFKILQIFIFKKHIKSLLSTERVTVTCKDMTRLWEKYIYTLEQMTSLEYYSHGLI